MFIGLFGCSRLEIFLKELSQEKKDKIQLKTVDFATKFMNFTNLKQVITSVRHDVP
jgi:hypothetical protein